MGGILTLGYCLRTIGHCFPIVFWMEENKVMMERFPISSYYYGKPCPLYLYLWKCLSNFSSYEPQMQLYGICHWCSVFNHRLQVIDFPKRVQTIGLFGSFIQHTKFSFQSYLNNDKKHINTSKKWPVVVWALDLTLQWPDDEQSFKSIPNFGRLYKSILSSCKDQLLPCYLYNAFSYICFAINRWLTVFDIQYMYSVR